MPLFRKVSIGTGLPMELWGLLNCTFYNGAMFGLTGAAHTAFWDACYVRGRTSGDSDGYYLVAGVGPSGAGQKVLVLSGAGAVKYLTPSNGGSGAPYTGCAAPIDASNNSKAVFVSIGSAASVRTTGLTTVTDIVAGYDTNGLWMAATPDNWPNRVETMPIGGGGLMIALGKANGSGKRLSFKNFTDNTTNAWSAATVPSPTTGGYVKGRIAQSGFTLALTGTNELHASTNILPSNVNFFHDAGSGIVYDICHSHVQNTFIMVSSNGVFTVNSNTGWPLGGPIPWEQQDLPEDFDHPCWCVAMDMPTLGTSAGTWERVGGIKTWYGIGFASTGTSVASNFLLTQDFNTYYGIEIAGLRKDLPFNEVFPNNTYLRFTGNRLFVFNQAGMSVSGQLGYLPQVFTASAS